jgi:multiple antibiotic resistance protein
MTLFRLVLEYLSYILTTVTALLPIINPLSTAALLPGISAHLSDAERHRQVKRGCYYMAGILITFLMAGGLIMDFFNISIPGLRIAGGMVVIYLGFRMLFPDTQPKLPDDPQTKSDISFTPLAMPSMAGPGSIAVVISMSSTLHSQKHIPIWAGYILLILGIAATASICWLTLRASSRLFAVLGDEGISAISRIMGFMLICIGVQFFINGVGDLLHDASFMPPSAEAVNTLLRMT